MDRPTRRLYARYPCSLKTVVRSGPAGKPLEAEMRNVGIGGAQLRVLGGIEQKRPIRLEVTCGREVFSIEATYVWTTGQDPKDRRYALFGVRFAMDANSLAPVKLLVDLVRREGGSPQLPQRISPNLW